MEGMKTSGVEKKKTQQVVGENAVEGINSYCLSTDVKSEQTMTFLLGIARTFA